MAIELTNRAGSTEDEVSSRVHTTEALGSLALSVMNTRPVPVAAHMVPVLLGARSIAATQPVPAAAHAPSRSMPNAPPVRSVLPVAPRRTKSPHAGLLKAVVNSGQFASRNAWFPPQSWVRHTD